MINLATKIYDTSGANYSCLWGRELGFLDDKSIDSFWCICGVEYNIDRDWTNYFYNQMMWLNNRIWNHHEDN